MKRVLVLPVSTTVTPEEIAQICELIRFAARSAPKLSSALARRASQQLDQEATVLEPRSYQKPVFESSESILAPRLMDGD